MMIRLLWSGERVSFEGEYYRLDNALCDPAPVQRPGPPILIGGSGERHLLRGAAQYRGHHEYAGGYEHRGA